MSAPRKTGVAVVRCAFAAVAMTACSAIWGQGLSDPTRPPPAWLAAQAKKADGLQDASSALPAASPGVSAAGVAEGEAAPRLQSILIGPSGKHAIINGQLVSVGATYKDAKLVEVSPTEVVLLSEHGRQTLKLFPDVEKHSVKPAAADDGRTPAKAKRRVNRRDTKAEKESK